MKYWAYINNKVAGPYDEKEIKTVEGFSSETLIYPEDAKEGETEWQTASDLIDLEPNTESDSKVENTIPENTSPTNAEKTIRESVDRLDKTLIGLKTTITKSAEMTHGEQTEIEKKLNSLTQEMQGFRSEMKEFLEYTKEITTTSHKTHKPSPYVVPGQEAAVEENAEPQPLPPSQQEDTVKLKPTDDKPHEKTEDKIENIIGKTHTKAEDNEANEITVSLDDEQDVKTVKSSTETIKHSHQDLKDTIEEAQKDSAENTENEEYLGEDKIAEDEKTKDGKDEIEVDDGEIKVIDVRTKQVLLSPEEQEKLEKEAEKKEKGEGEKTEESAPEQKPSEEIKIEEDKKEEEPKKETEEHKEDSEEDDFKILEDTIREVQQLNEENKDKDKDEVVEEGKDEDKKNKDAKQKTLSEMVLEDSTSVISDFIPDQEVSEKNNSDELSNEEIENLAENIITKDDDNAEEKSRIDLVAQGIDQKVDHVDDPVKNRKKPQDIKTIPGDEDEDIKIDNESEIETLEQASEKETGDAIKKDDDEVVIVEENKPLGEVVEDQKPEDKEPEVIEEGGKDDGKDKTGDETVLLKKDKSKYILIIIIILLLIGAGYFMGFGKFLKESYFSKKEGQTITTLNPTEPAPMMMEGEMTMEDTEGIISTEPKPVEESATMQEDGFATSTDLVFPEEEIVEDKVEEIITSTQTAKIPTPEQAVEYEVKNYKLATGLNLEETIIN
ncbi:MAG: hypothetical protein HN833_00770, partial [Elusimicrobiaceae bacterium]|nr:hypothetical protein [Elusimicrobiaceae bacterium]